MVDGKHPSRARRIGASSKSEIAALMRDLIAILDRGVMAQRSTHEFVHTALIAQMKLAKTVLQDALDEDPRAPLTHRSDPPATRDKKGYDR